MSAADFSNVVPICTEALASDHRMLDAISNELRRARSDIPRLEREVARLRETLGQARRLLATNQALLAEARHRAHSDALTGLPNRHGFDEFSARALAAHLPGAHVLALLFVDLDGFEAVNDRLGRHRVSLRASVGIAMYPQDGQTMAALMDHADRAMYAAKFGGARTMPHAPEPARGA